MNDMFVVDSQELDEGWEAGHQDALKLCKEFNDGLKDTEMSRDWKCSYVLGFLDTFVAQREALDIYLDEVEDDERIGLE